MLIRSEINKVFDTSFNIYYCNIVNVLRFLFNYRIFKYNLIYVFIYIFNFKKEKIYFEIYTID